MHLSCNKASHFSMNLIIWFLEFRESSNMNELKINEETTKILEEEIRKKDKISS